ncbi:MAG: AAA family ATPase [Planctomycetota bacterium]
MQSNQSSYTAPPFPAFPCTSRYVELGSVDEAYSRVCGSIEARETISLIIGPPGTGKSLVYRMLAERYSEDCDVVTLGETPIESRYDLLTRLVHQLNLDYQTGADPQLALVDFLNSKQAAPGGLLILVDEAQSLSVEVIEAIRMVTNIMRRGEPCVFTAMFGGVKLDETLVDTALDAFTQRIATRCYLHPMTADETRQYICETIQACGSEPAETITSEAIAAVHHACSGIPRLINQMMTQAIECAAEEDQDVISEQIIDQAWAQLQQLPSPIVDAPKVASKSAPIEFGELDDAVDYDSADNEAAVYESSDADSATEFITDVTQSPEAPYAETAPSTEPATAEPTDGDVTSEQNVVSGQVITEVNYVEIETTIVPKSETYVDGTADDRGDEIVAIQTMDDFYPTSIAGEAVPYQDLVLQSESDMVEVEPSRPESPAISAQDLFGDFEEEEEIAVGKRYGDASASAAGETYDAGETYKASEAGVPDPIEAPAEAPKVVSEASSKAADTSYQNNDPVVESATEIEEILHQEIVGISQMAGQLMSDVTSESNTQATEVPQWSQWKEVNESSEPIGDGSDILANADDEPIEVSEEGKSPALWIADDQAEVIEEGTPENEVTDVETDIQLSRDDSDMLVIEDELELRRVDPASKRDSHNKTISVDFQAMLARMRSANQ